MCNYKIIIIISCCTQYTVELRLILEISGGPMRSMKLIDKKLNIISGKAQFDSFSHCTNEILLLIYTTQLGCCTHK